MGEIQVFSFENHEVRTVAGADGDPWWVAADVCRVLEITKPENAYGRLDPDEKGTRIIGTPGGPQSMTVINESGLYSLILTSRKPEAKRFKKWVTSEVLPSIRKTGKYAVGDGGINPRIAAARQLCEMVERQVEAEERLARVEVELHAARVEAAGAEAKAEVALTTLLDNTKYMALVGFNALNKLGLTRQELANEGRIISRACSQAGIEIKTVPSEVWGRVNAYPVAVLEQWRKARFGDPGGMPVGVN